EDGYTVTNLRVGKTEVPVEKVWKGSEEESVTINLLANGDKVDSIELDPDNDWTHTFTDLAEFDEEGQAIEYTVEEVEIDGYISSITGDAKEGFTVTNTRSGTTEVTINKTWKDDNDATKNRPNTINVNLLQNGIVYGDSHEVSASDDWSLTISDLPKYDDEGVEYEYTISEHDVPGYEAEILGFDITNTRTDEKSIEITKAWLDDNSENRPTEIVVELFRSIEDGDKEKVDTYKVTAEENWSLIIDQLPVFDEDGKAYTYEIEEREIDGYAT